MYRVFLIGIFFAALTTGSLAYGQVAHEPTSATDSEIKVHKKRGGLFSTRAGSKKKHRAREREGQALQSNRFKSQARSNENHGKPLRKNKVKNRHRVSDSRQYQRHASATRDGVKSRNRATRRPQ